MKPHSPHRGHPDHVSLPSPPPPTPLMCGELVEDKKPPIKSRFTDCRRMGGWRGAVREGRAARLLAEEFTIPCRGIDSFLKSRRKLPGISKYEYGCLQ